ncbi:hypothetical protein C8R45DRAFT_948094 [Mycena sanguinolenta]|nr:hypothetical protein C8R45DRAFT_948094 [Mycena sanguinolenta]
MHLAALQPRTTAKSSLKLRANGVTSVQALRNCSRGSKEPTHSRHSGFTPDPLQRGFHPRLRVNMRLHGSSAAESVNRFSHPSFLTIRLVLFQGLLVLDIRWYLTLPGAENRVQLSMSASQQRRSDKCAASDGDKQWRPLVFARESKHWPTASIGWQSTPGMCFEMPQSSVLHLFWPKSRGTDHRRNAERRWTWLNSVKSTKHVQYLLLFPSFTWVSVEQLCAVKRLEKDCVDVACAVLVFVIGVNCLFRDHTEFAGPFKNISRDAEAPEFMRHLQGISSTTATGKEVSQNPQVLG